MEFTKVEVAEIEFWMTNESPVRELAELELATVGGGIADVIGA